MNCEIGAAASGREAERDGEREIVYSQNVKVPFGTVLQTGWLLMNLSQMGTNLTVFFVVVVVANDRCLARIY